MDPNSPILRRFPLVARPRPKAKALTARVDELRALAERADRENDLGAASAVYNQAALIASDCGQPELARQWCRDHADAYLWALPLGAQVARLAMEPLVNLARLHIRDGDGDAALRLLTDLFQAVSSRTDALIDGYPLPASRLTRIEGDHRRVRQWLWSVLVADGTRALTSAGRWQEAYDHLHRRNGIGQRMLDGRQVAVISHATSGDLEAARSIVSETFCIEPWEQAVTACLAYLLARTGSEPADEYLSAMLDRYRRLRPMDGFAVFHTRLGLAIIDAVGGANQPSVQSLANDLVNHAVALGDAYAAQSVLKNEDLSARFDQQGRDLSAMVSMGGLERGRIPTAAYYQICRATAMGKTVILRLIPKEQA